MSSSSGWSNYEELNETTFNRVLKELDYWATLPRIMFKIFNNLQRWNIELEQGSQGTLYAGEIYHIEVQIPQDYPFIAPKVIFMDPVPVHPQVYSDGHICLDDLYDDWTASKTLRDVCISIGSMLSRASVKEKPKYTCKHGRSP